MASVLANQLISALYRNMASIKSGAGIKAAMAAWRGGGNGVQQQYGNIIIAMAKSGVSCKLKAQ
jgi:hypothetical protein